MQAGVASSPVSFTVAPDESERSQGRGWRAEQGALQMADAERATPCSGSLGTPARFLTRGGCSQCLLNDDDVMELGWQWERGFDSPPLPGTQLCSRWGEHQEAIPPECRIPFLFHPRDTVLLSVSPGLTSPSCHISAMD